MNTKKRLEEANGDRAPDEMLGRPRNKKFFAVRKLVVSSGLTEKEIQMNTVPECISGGGTNRLKEVSPLIGQFLSRLPKRLAQVDAALESNDWKSVELLAHQVRGALGCYGFQEVAEEAHRIETIAKTTCSTPCARKALDSIRHLLTLTER